MLSIVLILIPLLPLVLGALLPFLAYRRTSDDRLAETPGFCRSAWMLPIVPDMLVAFVLLLELPGLGATYGNTALLVTMTFFVAIAFLCAFLITRDKRDRTTFLVSLTISAVFALISTILPGIATTYLEYKDSSLTMLATIVIGLYPFVALGYALLERQEVEYRALRRRGADASELAGSPTPGTGFQRAWLAPAVVCALIGASTIFSLVNDGTSSETIWAMLIANSLVPAAFFLAYYSTRAKKDKTAFLASAAIWAVMAVVVAVLPSITYPQSYDYAPETLVATAVMAAFPIIALGFAIWWCRGVAERSRKRTGGHPAASSSRRIDAPAATTAAEVQPTSAPDASGSAARTLFEEALGVGVTETPAADAQPSPQPATTPNPVAAPATPAAPTSQQTAFTVDVNTCSEMDLLNLQGMTITVARAAVAERNEHGPYRSVEDFVGRNALKPHFVIMFIDNLTCSQPSARPSGNRRPRTLDL